MQGQNFFLTFLEKNLFKHKQQQILFSLSLSFSVQILEKDDRS